MPTKARPNARKAKSRASQSNSPSVSGSSNPSANATPLDSLQPSPAPSPLAEPPLPLPVLDLDLDLVTPEMQSLPAEEGASEGAVVEPVIQPQGQLIDFAGAMQEYATFDNAPTLDLDMDDYGMEATISPAFRQVPLPPPSEDDSSVKGEGRRVEESPSPLPIPPRTLVGEDEEGEGRLERYVPSLARAVPPLHAFPVLHFRPFPCVLSLSLPMRCLFFWARRETRSLVFVLCVLLSPAFCSCVRRHASTNSLKASCDAIQLGDRGFGDG